MRAIKEVESEIRMVAQKEGYLLNPDQEIREGIIEGIAVNEEKLGYWNCPCRRASGDRASDQDIICPCSYRDADLAEYGRCYCALYVTQEYLDKGSPSDPIPERRKGKPRDKTTEEDNAIPDGHRKGKIKTWRCVVCGYLCARPEPPPVCPICRAKKEMFEEYDL